MHPAGRSVLLSSDRLHTRAEGYAMRAAACDRKGRGEEVYLLWNLLDLCLPGSTHLSLTAPSRLDTDIQRRGGFIARPSSRLGRVRLFARPVTAVEEPVRKMRAWLSVIT